MNIPTINSITFKDRGREVGKAVEDVAKKSRERATNLIRTEMMNTGECSELWSLSLVDLTWVCKRGKGHNFLTGQAPVISLTTCEILEFHNTS